VFALVSQNDGDKFFEICRWKGRMHDQDIWRRRNDGDRREILHWIVLKLGVEARVEPEARRYDDDRVTVGWRACRYGSADIACTSGNIFDIERLRTTLGKFRGDDTGDSVIRTSWRVRHNDANWASWRISAPARARHRL